MKVIAIDDEPLMLKALVTALNASEDIESVKEFSSCDACLEWVKDNYIDAAFMDIYMRGMGGLALAQKIMEIHPDCKIVFCTGYERYAVPAFKLRASGYLMKPVSAQDVQDEINHIKGLRAGKKPLKVQCFGNFDAYVHDEKITFRRTKTKELLAYLIDRRGAGANVKEICAVLWPGDGDESKYHNYVRQLFMDLRNTLDKAEIGDILIQQNYNYSLDIERIECDYYSCLETGKPEFHGEYMKQYSWAESTCALLWQKNIND